MNIDKDLPSDESVDEQWERPAPLPRPEQFHHIAPWKFLVMSVATFGLYEMYWCYRCWQYVERMGSRNIWPIARGIFCSIFFFFLAEEIDNGLRISRTFRSACLALLYIALIVISYLWDPYWMIALAAPLVMMPLVIDVDRLNRHWGVVGKRYSRFGFGHIAITLLGSALLLLATLQGSGLLPSTQVVDGSEVPSRVVKVLGQYELLAENESITYFYAAGYFSFLVDGNYFTENRVVSYWSESGEFYADEADYGSIASIEPHFSEDLYEYTEINVMRNDESEFILYVSAEEERDHLFVDELLARWKEVRQPSDAADDAL